MGSAVAELLGSAVGSSLSRLSKRGSYRLPGAGIGLQKGAGACCRRAAAAAGIGCEKAAGTSCWGEMGPAVGHFA